MECMFVEMDVFTNKVVRLGLEEDLWKLQMRLRKDPRAGDVDPGTCGMRKVRMTDSPHRRGKRGGARVHYFYHPPDQIVYLMWLYTKGEQDTLTADQKRELCRWVRSLGTE